MDEELLIAVSELRKMPYGAVWFIPVLLDHVRTSRRPIAPGLTLQDLHWVSLVENWNDGVERIASLTLDLEKKSAENR